MIKLLLLNNSPMLFNRAHIVGVYPTMGGCQVITVNGSYTVKHSLSELMDFLGVESING